jgi:hypothetical protein
MKEGSIDMITAQGIANLILIYVSAGYKEELGSYLQLGLKSEISAKYIIELCESAINVFPTLK